MDGGMVEEKEEEEVEEGVGGTTTATSVENWSKSYEVIVAELSVRKFVTVTFRRFLRSC